MERKRTNPCLDGKPLMVALDGLSTERILEICQELQGLVSVVSLNTATLMAHPYTVDDLRKMGVSVFADVMLYATPKTMHGLMSTLCFLGVRSITVSFHSGEAARKEALRSKSDNVSVLYTCMLSSVDNGEFHEMYGGDLRRFQYYCLKKAVDEGADGVLLPASALYRPLFTPPPMPTQVIPGSQHLIIVGAGVRPTGYAARGGYHAAVTTARAAMLNGISVLDMGEPIAQAVSPRAVVMEIYDEIGFDPQSNTFIPGRSAYQR